MRTQSKKLLLFLTFSALVANPKKTTLHGGQSRSWSAEQGKKEKEKVWQRTPPPPPPARCSFGEKIKKNKKIKKNRKSRGASTCLGATQAGVTQVVSVRLRIHGSGLVSPVHSIDDVWTVVLSESPWTANIPSFFRPSICFKEALVAYAY